MRILEFCSDNHHHEVATAGQCEIDIKYDLMTNSADGAQTYKYVVRNVAQEFGKSGNNDAKTNFYGLWIWNAY